MPLVGAAPARLRLADSHDDITVRQVPAGSGDPVVCREFDPGAPEIRESVQPRTGGDGTIDASAYTGSRVVTFDLVVFGDQTDSAYGYAERLAAMAHPTRRPWLYVQREGLGEEWRIGLRGNPFSIAYGRRAAALLELSLTFTAPEGYFESGVRGIDSGAAPATSEGLILPTTFPIVLGGDIGSFNHPLTVGSSVPVAPLLYFYGPAADPRAELATGEVFSTAGLGLDSGQFLQVDMAAGTVLLNGDRGSSVYHLVDWSESSFWRLHPGTNYVSYGTSQGRMYLQWRDRRLTV